MYFTTVNGEIPLDWVDPEAPVPTEPPVSIAYSLHFAGDVTGHFGLSIEQKSAQSLAANFLGEESDDISSKEVHEVLGELANMFCGSVMSKVEGENKFVLSHPEEIHVTPSASEGDILISKLDTDSGVITVWVAVEGNPC
jgi:CheY-specific phosphatase CheX